MHNQNSLLGKQVSISNSLSSQDMVQGFCPWEVTPLCFGSGAAQCFSFLLSCSLHLDGHTCLRVFSPQGSLFYTPHQLQPHSVPPLLAEGSPYQGQNLPSKNLPNRYTPHWWIKQPNDRYPTWNSEAERRGTPEERKTTRTHVTSPGIVSIMKWLNSFKPFMSSQLTSFVLKTERASFFLYKLKWDTTTFW